MHKAIMITSETDKGKILVVPDWMQSLVVDMDDCYVALETPMRRLSLFDENCMNTEFGRKRRYKRWVSFKEVCERA